MKLTAIMSVLGILLFTLPVAASESLNSQRIIELVRKNHKEVRKATIDKQLADLQRKIVVSRALPHVGLSAEFARTNMLGEIVQGDTQLIPVIDTTTGQQSIYATPTASFAIGSNRLGNVFQAKAKAEWVLFAGGRFWAGLELAKLTRTDTDYKIARILDDGIYQALKAYNDVLLATAALEVVKEGKSLTQSHVKRVRKLFESGYASDLDVLKAESAAAEMDPAIIEAGNNVDLATDLLLMLVGLNFGTKVTLQPFGDETIQTTKDTDTLVDQAQHRRPELASVLIKHDILQQQKKIAIGTYLPSVALFGEYATKYGTQLPPLHKDWINGWTIGIGASWTLFDGLEAKAKYGMAKLHEEQLELGKSQLLDGIQQEISAAHRHLAASKKMHLVRKEQVTRVQKQLALANTQFAEGLASNIDVLDAQLALTRARLAAEAAYRAVVTNSLQLSLKTGAIQDLGK